jgi:cobalt/nickel transport system permease protein
LINIDRYAYASYLRDMHPADKLSLAVMTMLLVLLVDSPGISGLVIIIMSLIVILGAGVKYRHYLQMMMIPMAFLLVSCATIAFDISLHQNQYSHSMVWGKIWIGFSYNSLVEAFNLLLRSLAATACLYFLALTTPMDQIIFVLRKMKMPAPQTTDWQSLGWGAPKHFSSRVGSRDQLRQQSGRPAHLLRQTQLRF